MDTQPGVPSADFSDGTTFGSISDDGGLSITVTDDPSNGVEVSVTGGAGTATLTVCPEALAIILTAGDIVLITCGSVEVMVVGGSAEIDLGGGVIVIVSEGATATVTDLGGGEFTVVNSGETGTVTVDVDGDTTELLPGDEPLTVTTQACADISGDGKVTGRDLRIVARLFGIKDGQPRFDPEADLNGDGVINVLDLAIVIQQLGDRCP